MLNSILLKYVYKIGTQPIFKKLVKSMSVICLLDSINCLRLPLSLCEIKKNIRPEILALLKNPTTHLTLMHTHTTEAIPCPGGIKWRRRL